MSNVAYQHLKSASNTGSGVSDSFLFAPISSFADVGIKCPTPPATNPSLADLVTITEDHEFITTKGFVEVICAPFKNGINATTIGEPGSQKFDQKLEVFVPGSYATLHGSIAQLMNTPTIVLVKDSSCQADMYYQLGCDCMYAWATAEFATGTTKDGQKGYKVTFSYPAEAIQIYTGQITKQA